MDLIYTTSAKTDIGVVMNYSWDYEESVKSEENTFALTVPRGAYSSLTIGSYIYSDDGAYGGRVDEYTLDTEKTTVTYIGRTWRGILESKIIMPPSSEPYYYVASGSASSVLATLLSDIGLTSIFEVGDFTDFNVNYQFDRFTDCYSGLMKLARKYNRKLAFSWSVVNKKAIIRLPKIKETGVSDELNADQYALKLTQKKGVNHLIGLGKGELGDRTIVHRYIDADGNISSTKYYTGANEIATIYEYSNAESTDELIKGTESKLQELAVEQEISATIDNIVADIGDKITAFDESIGITLTQFVTKKIIKMSSDSSTKISYEIGEW